MKPERPRKTDYRALGAFLAGLTALIVTVILLIRKDPPESVVSSVFWIVLSLGLMFGAHLRQSRGQ